MNLNCLFVLQWLIIRRKIGFNLAVLIGIAVGSSRKCDFTVNISFALFNEICITESDNRYISLSVAVVVCNCNDNRFFSCRLNTVREIYNYIVAFADIYLAVRNNNIGFIGYCDYKSFFCFTIFFTDSAVVIVCICLVVRNDKLTVCISSSSHSS